MFWVKMILPPVAGAIFGFVYYKTVGCVTGTCPITSNPWISTIYGGGMGFLISLIIKGS
jgi:hypothetical protein